MEDGLKIDFSNAPTLGAALRSKALIRAIIGPAGSGKTFGVFNVALAHAIQQEPAPDGCRYTRVVVIRNTYDMLQRMTLKTAMTALGTLGRFVESKPPKGLVEFKMDDDTRVRMEIEFLALDTPDALNRLLGSEMTWVIIDEVSELIEDVISRAVSRVGRYPSGRFGTPTSFGILATTNGPKQNHWLYEWYIGARSKEFAALEEKLGRPYFHLFKQPGGLIPPSDPADFRDPSKWKPNPKAENVKNLPGEFNYYFQQLSQSNDEIKTYVLGDFVKQRKGTPVFTEFSRDLHVLPSDGFFLQEGMELGISADFGRTPVILLWTTLPNGRLVVIDEFMDRNASIADLLARQVWPALQGHYSRYQVTWATGDPAGLIGGQGIGTSPYEVMQTAPYYLPMEPPPIANRIEPRLACMRAALITTIGGGVPMFGVTSNCTFLIAALEADYIYEQKRGEEGAVKDEPTKSHENWCSDIADAGCYGVQYRMARGRKRQDFASNRKKRRRLA